MPDIADLEDQENKPVVLMLARIHSSLLLGSERIPIDTGNQLIESKWCRMGPVLSPDRPVCMLPAVWTIVGGFEGVEYTENQHEKPRQCRQDFVGQ